MNILNKLTIKHLKMNKKRTIVTIIGIVLSTALMVGIGLLLSTFREALIKESIMYNGDYNAKISSVEKYRLNIVENNANVSKTIYRGYIGYSKMNDETFDLYKIYGVNDEYMEHFTLIDGELPKNDSEIVIPSYLLDRPELNLKIGSILKLNVGDRYVDGAIATLPNYVEGEYINEPVLKTYKIVGVIDRDIYEDYEVGCYIYTKSDKQDSIEVFITYKNPNKTYDHTKSISSALGIKYNSDEYNSLVSYNDVLLSLYGTSSYDNFINGLSGVLSIMLTIVSVACIIVIYNSFAISVMERKKQFGLFSSIGATKSQLRRTVLYEAFIVSIIGIPLGILGAYIGIGAVSLVMNNLLKDMMDMKFTLATYPIFLIIPIIFMIITILISAFIPAKRASKISPIEAIRMNDDIKIKGKKVKSPKWVRRIFGVEGDIAYKNMKRNKKKYRITVVSLFISIVMFVSFSGFMKYTIASATDYISLPNADIFVSCNKDACNQNVIDNLRTNSDVKRASEFFLFPLYLDSKMSDMYTDEYSDFLKDNEYELDQSGIYVIALKDKDFDKYMKTIGETKEKPILYNSFKGIVYKENSRKSYDLNKYGKNKVNIELAIDLTEYGYEDGDDSYYIKTTETDDKSKVKHIKTIDDYYVSSKGFFGLDSYEEIQAPTIVISQNMAEEYGLFDIQKLSISQFLLVEAPSYKNFSKAVEEYRDNGKMDNMQYGNIREEMKMLKNFLLVIKILVYGFIALVTLIGVTSVFNTINTSIALRRKEFAVLRSIGLTPQGFNKTLRFESLFFGIKSLIYALPVSIGVIYLIHNTTSEFVQMRNLLIPWTSILIAIVGVFAVIAISMMYATKKLKQDNILDAIREENI